MQITQTHRCQYVFYSFVLLAKSGEAMDMEWEK